jgi:hypothetical protein
MPCIVAVQILYSILRMIVYLKAVEEQNTKKTIPILARAVDR